MRGQTPRIEDDFHDPDEVRAVPARKPVVPPDALPPRDPANDPARPAVGLTNEKIHHVGHRETLGAICRAYYGDAGLAEEVARFNGLSDPNKVQEGMRLRLPELADRAPTGVPATSTTQVPTPAALRTYTVKPNDSLARIAKRELGAEKRWEEIYNLNRKVLRSPDHVVEGIVLALPAR
jgi:nucleoid-associated protein YgaU